MECSTALFARFVLHASAGRQSAPERIAPESRYSMFVGSSCLAYRLTVSMKYTQETSTRRPASQVPITARFSHIVIVGFIGDASRLGAERQFRSSLRCLEWPSGYGSPNR